VIAAGSSFATAETGVGAIVGAAAATYFFSLSGFDTASAIESIVDAANGTLCEPPTAETEPCPITFPPGTYEKSLPLS
jgi:hypothetical protein